MSSKDTDGLPQPPVAELLNFSRKARVENITDDAHGPKNIVTIYLYIYIYYTDVTHHQYNWGRSIRTNQFDSADSICNMFFLEVRLIVETSNTWSAGGDVKSTPMPLGPLEPLLQATWWQGRRPCRPSIQIKMRLIQTVPEVRITLARGRHSFGLEPFNRQYVLKAVKKPA